jgi:polysaccharide chain length determinant protein (PEP-CTERM system associated)
MGSLIDELKVILHGIWQRRWLAMAVAWAVCLIGWLVVALLPSYYETRTRIQINIEDVVPEAGTGLDAQRRFDQLRQALTSTRNLEQVAIASGMVDRAADAGARAGAGSSLQQAIRVMATPDNIMDVTVTLSDNGRSGSETATLVKSVAENLVTVFRDEQIRGGTADAQQTLQFLDNQINELQTKLSAAQQALSGFEARNIGILPGPASGANRLESARAEISQIDMQLVSINAQLGATPPTITIPGMPGTANGMARQQLASAQNELNGMRARGLTDQHPDIITIRAQIAALQQQVTREPAGGTNATTQANPAYAGLVGQRNGLQARRAQLSGELARINATRIQEPAVAAEYDRLTREYSTLKEQNDTLTRRREQVRMRGDANANASAVRIDVLDRPTAPSAPAAPNKPLFVMAVLFAGLAAGLAVAFAVSQVQTTYPTAARLARASGLPVIGSVTEQLTAELLHTRRQKLRRFAFAGAGLVLMCAVLLTVEVVQRAQVG